MEQTLEKIASSNPGAKEVIDRARADYTYNSFVEAVELDPTLDKTLEDILRNIPDELPPG